MPAQAGRVEPHGFARGLNGVSGTGDCHAGDSRLRTLRHYKRLPDQHTGPPCHPVQRQVSWSAVFVSSDSHMHLHITQRQMVCFSQTLACSALLIEGAAGICCDQCKASVAVALCVCVCVCVRVCVCVLQGSSREPSSGSQLGAHQTTRLQLPITSLKVHTHTCQVTHTHTRRHAMWYTRYASMGYQLTGTHSLGTWHIL